MADYATVAQVKAHLPDETFGATYDTILASLVTRASRLIDRNSGREDDAFAVSADATRYLDGDGGRRLWVGELAAAPTTVAVAEGGDIDDASGAGGTYTTWATSDYIVWPRNAVAEGRPILTLDVEPINGAKAVWFNFPKAVKITGRWGYSTSAPELIVEATIIQTVRWLKRAQQTFQDTGMIPELGQLRFTKKLDPEVAGIIESFSWVAV